ncbi:hypothetical protein [Micromonospora mirobrigensis]|uniref:hypothetical protein n=1 Tax=Micromonospora mirobrigensis TaxID=262898 RepID=UPI000B861BCB|nr:hypothetical protein [Micromonospora mirobrigensis]
MLAAGLTTAALALQPLAAGAAGSTKAKPEPAPAAPAATDRAGAADGHSATPAQRARMAAEAPLAKVAARIRTAAVAKPSGFAGVELRDGAVTVYWKGDVPTDMQRMLDDEGRKVPVTVRQAAWSASEMSGAATALAGRVRADKARAGTLRSVTSLRWSIRGDGLTATVADGGKTPAALPDVGVPVTVVEETDPAGASGRGGSPARKPAAAAATGTDSASATGTLAGVTWPDPSRQDDTTPAWGGAHLINTNATGGNHGWLVRLADGNIADADTKWHCTSGFPVLDSTTNTELMVGAATCGTPGNTYVDPSGDVVNETAGVSSAWYQPGRGVILTRPKGGAEPFIYDGGSWGQDGWQIAGWEAPITGQQVCIAGAETGTYCEVTVSEFVGNQTAWLANAQGGSDQVSGMTMLYSHPTGSPIDPNKRVWTLKDGSPCNGYEFFSDIDSTQCPNLTFLPGDMGAAVYVLPGQGPQTGVIIKGMIARVHNDNPNDSFWHLSMVGTNEIQTAFPSVVPLTAANDRK